MKKDEQGNIIEYIGDGVYIKFDGYGIWLLANHHENPTDRVYLELDVLRRLNEFVDGLKENTK